MGTKADTQAEAVTQPSATIRPEKKIGELEPVATYCPWSLGQHVRQDTP